MSTINEYNLDAHREKRLPVGTSLFRSQPKGHKEPYNFTKMPFENRFVPSENNTAVTYAALSDMSAYLEGEEIFRSVSIKKRPAVIRLSREKMERREMIEFSLSEELSMMDLESETAYARHRMKSDDPIVCSRKSKDLRTSHEAAQYAVEQGYDGIIFRTRQGGFGSLAIFDSARGKLENHKEISRNNVSNHFTSTPKNQSEFEKNLSVEIIDDLAPV